MIAATTSEIFDLPAALPLECDELLICPSVAFETYGTPNVDRAVLLLPGVVQSQRAASGTPASAARPYSPDAWFADVVGPGKAIDTDRCYVIAASLLGSPWGSSSPLVAHPESGFAYGPEFPAVTATDMARAAAALCRGLGITRLRGVVGLSLGGAVALRMAAIFPDLCEAVAVLGATSALPDTFRRRLASVAQVLEADRAFRGGVYPHAQPPVQTLARLRLAMLRDLTPRDHLTQVHGDLFAAERALEAEARSFAEQFDANCYLALCRAHARADLHEVLNQRLRARTLLLTASSDPVAPPERARDTYHRLTAVGTRARYHELQSDAGQRAYQLEGARVGQVLREFFGH